MKLQCQIILISHNDLLIGRVRKENMECFSQAGQAGSVMMKTRGLKNIWLFSKRLNKCLHSMESFAFFLEYFQISTEICETLSFSGDI